MARRQDATKEHVLHGPATEEQRRRRAIFGETLRAEVFFSDGLVARRAQGWTNLPDPCFSPLNQNSASSNVRVFLLGCWPDAPRPALPGEIKSESLVGRSRNGKSKTFPRKFLFPIDTPDLIGVGDWLIL